MIPSKWRQALASAWLATGVALAVILIRSLLIVTAHSPTIDEQYHLYRGLALLTGTEIHELWNDPPPGSALIALPVWLLGLAPQSPADLAQPLIHAPVSVQTVQWVIAAWKTLLLWPLLALLFTWARALYGVGAAWFVLGLVTFEPTLAAMTPVATPDTLGITGVVLAMFATWRAIESPTTLRLVIVGVACAVAAVLKHTGAITPIVATVFLSVGWYLARRRGDDSLVGVSLPRVITRRISVCALAAALSLWAFTGFDISAPANWGRQVNATYTEQWSFRVDVINNGMNRPMPAGMYLGSFIEAYNHGVEGHSNYFNGEVTTDAGWTFFPIVASYKVPIGYAAVGLLAIGSLLWRRPRRDEMWVLLAAVIWVAFVMSSGITIGFRHMLPGYVFLLLLCGRAVARPSHSGQRLAGAARIAAVVGLAAGAGHALTWHPNYIPYINRPDEQAFLTISDSNIDWGQPLKILRRWYDAQPPQAQPMTVMPWGMELAWVEVYFGKRAVAIEAGKPLPDSGLLAISASWLPWLAEYRELLAHEPVAVLGGGAMRVYDMDAFHRADVEATSAVRYSSADHAELDTPAHPARDPHPALRGTPDAKSN